MTDRKIMIGGQALKNLGHDRHTDDVDYLVSMPGRPVFVHETGCDLVNAAAHPFLGEVWEALEGSEAATPQALLELKAWSWINYLQNFDFRSAAKAEYDMQFLVREFGLTDTPILAKHAHAGEIAEVRRFLAGVKK